MDAVFFSGTLCFVGVKFDARLTLIDSAQVFCWKEYKTEQGTHFEAVIDGRKVSLTQREDGFMLRGIDEEDIPFWWNYFDLDRDYDAVIESCSGSPTAQRAMQLLPGLRVLNQPPWETLLTFILSANNNVSRIRQLVEKLISSFGEDGAFPTPKKLASVGEEELRAIGCGYRAPYLIKTAQMVEGGFPLNALRHYSYEDAHKKLLTLSGVGDKVADCVQLFSLGHSEAFPVDVWVERLMKQWFPSGESGKRAIVKQAHRLFGINAGIVQQSLFHCARLGLIELKSESN